MAYYNIQDSINIRVDLIASNFGNIRKLPSAGLTSFLVLNNVHEMLEASQAIVVIYLSWIEEVYFLGYPETVLILLLMELVIGARDLSLSFFFETLGCFQ